MRKFKLMWEVVLLLIIVFFIVYMNTISSSVAQVKMPGPPMFCGNNQKLKEVLSEYKEEELIVLLKDNEINTYYILFRNSETSSWTILLYNIPGALSNLVCLTSGGEKSFILPDIQELKEMIDRQEKGFKKFNPVDPKINTKLDININYY